MKNIKKNILYTLLASATSVFFMSYSDGRASSGSDSTGRVSASQTCQSCHNGGAFGNATTTIAVLNSNGVATTAYSAGQSYTVRITIGSATASPAAGFGAVVVATSTGQPQAGSLTAITSNVKIVSLNNRQYAEHPSPSTSKIFEFRWTAPATGTGIVKVFAAGTAVNLNGGSGGDSATPGASLTLTEAIVATDDTSLPQVSVRVLQNPTSDVLRLQLNTVDAGDYTLQLFDLAGKSCLTQTQKLETGENNLQLPLENLSSGIYLLSLQANGRIVHTEKIIVQ